MINRTKYPYFRDLLKEMRDSDNLVLQNTGNAFLSNKIPVYVMHEDLKYGDEFEIDFRTTPVILEEIQGAAAAATRKGIFLTPRWYYLNENEIDVVGEDTLYIEDGYDDCSDKEYLFAILAHELNHYINQHRNWSCVEEYVDWFNNSSDEEYDIYNVTTEYHAYNVGHKTVLNYSEEDIRKTIKKNYDVDLSEEAFDSACHLNWNTDNHWS